MKLIALQQAKARLVRATEAKERLFNATSLDEAEAAWSDFLLATSTIYSKLEQGAKGCGVSQGWFGRKKKERRDDGLMRYLHYARNSDEHGIERTVETTTDNPSLRFNERYELQVQRLDDETKQPVEVVFDSVVSGPTIRPIRAHDTRFNDYCDPPTHHRGEEIQRGRNFCSDIAAKGLAYLGDLIAEAESLPHH
jgi:hypothetical protein